MTSPNLKGVLFQSNGFQCLAAAGDFVNHANSQPHPRRTGLGNGLGPSQ